MPLESNFLFSLHLVFSSHLSLLTLRDDDYLTCLPDSLALGLFLLEHHRGRVPAVSVVVVVDGGSG